MININSNCEDNFHCDSHVIIIMYFSFIGRMVKIDTIFNPINSDLILNKYFYFMGKILNMETFFNVASDVIIFVSFEWIIDIEAYLFDIESDGDVSSSVFDNSIKRALTSQWKLLINETYKIQTSGNHFVQCIWNKVLFFPKWNGKFKQYNDISTQKR